MIIMKINNIRMKIILNKNYNKKEEKSLASLIQHKKKK